MSSQNTSKCLFSTVFELVISAGVLTIAGIIIMKDINERIIQSVAENTRHYEQHIGDLNREITELQNYATELENKIILTPQTGVHLIEEISQVENIPNINA